VLPSSYDTSPFVVVEALACGVPVVGSAEGGLPEMVRDGGSGLLVDPLNAETLAQTLMRLNNEEELRTRLASGASADGLGRRIGPATDRIESVLVGAVGRPRGVWIGRAVVHRPLEPTVEKRFEILARYMDVTIISVGDRGKKREGGARLILFPRSPAFLSSLLFYFGSPPLALWKARRARSAVICQSPHSAFGPIALSRLIPRSARPRVIVEVHGDWRSSSRHYGGAMRRSVAPLADAVASWAVKRADRVRTVGSATTDIARAAGYRGEIDTFVTFSDLGPFVSRPRSEFPEGETVAFVGALERVKGIDVLLDAWDRVIEAHPQASLLIAGEGSLHERWTRPGVELLGRVPTEELVDVLDRSVCLVLPSRSEGTPRVILEAMARGRAVVASAVGAIPEMVEDGMTGRLVQPEDPVPLAAALIELLDDKERAARMGAAAADAFQERDQSKGFEAGMARTATWIGLDG
jgi:glycosyltransferase involved in cell wall biosynthesis